MRLGPAREESNEGSLTWIRRLLVRCAESFLGNQKGERYACLNRTRTQILARWHQFFRQCPLLYGVAKHRANGADQRDYFASCQRRLGRRIGIDETRGGTSVQVAVFSPSQQ